MFTLHTQMTKDQWAPIPLDITRRYKPMVKCLILEACRVADVKDTEKKSNRTERWALELAAGKSRRRIRQHYSESPCCQTSVTYRTGEEMREKNSRERDQSLTNADFMGVSKSIRIHKRGCK